MQSFRISAGDATNPRAQARADPLRDQEREVHLTAELPAELARAILEDLGNLRALGGATEEGDTVIG